MKQINDKNFGGDEKNSHFPFTMNYKTKISDKNWVDEEMVIIFQNVKTCGNQQRKNRKGCASFPISLLKISKCN